MRRTYIALIAAAVVVFLAVSALLARVFSADSAERSAVTGLIQAEARGDQAGMLRRIEGCSLDARCRARVVHNASTLRHPGALSILQLQSSTGFSLTGTVGMARVAWTAGRSLPIVQCVEVHRTGNAASGLRVVLVGITAKLSGDATCPARLY